MWWPSPERIAADVLRACGISADWVWLVQADGSTQRIGVAAWNAQRQQAPGPRRLAVGAPKHTRLARTLQHPRIAQVLAEQGVAEGTDTPQAVPAAISPAPAGSATERE